MKGRYWGGGRLFIIDKLKSDNEGPRQPVCISV